MVLAVRENRERALGRIEVEMWEEGFEGLGEGHRASRMLRVKSEPQVGLIYRPSGCGSFFILRIKSTL